MAVAEARAAWQRTANRCLVQEDAKRAPRLGCCSSLPPSAKHPDDTQTEPPPAPTAQDIPTTRPPPPFNPNPSSSNLSPNSRWWLHLQPNYGYQKALMEEHLHSLQPECNTTLMQESSDFESSFDSQFTHVTTCDNKEDAGFLNKVSKNANELYFDSDSSWIGAERNTPWWRTADTEELAILVAQTSLDHLENCDLPSPQNTRPKKDVDVNTWCFRHDEVFTPSMDQKPAIGSHHRLSTHTCKSGSLTERSSCEKLWLTAEAEMVSSANKPFSSVPKTRYSATHERMPGPCAVEDEASKSQLLEALRHSQTRAREAEKVARQACAEKEHVVKLVFRQASQLFAYKQWLYLLQLENMYSQFRYNKKQPSPTAVAGVLPWTPQRPRKMRKTWQRCSSRKWGKRGRPRYDVGKYAIVFALGVGLVGAGLLLGWTIGWMLPTW